jgi:hypothetical protein
MGNVATENTSVVAETPETQEEAEDDESASVLNGSPDVASAPLPLMMDEPGPEVGDEEEPPFLEATDKERGARVVTYVEQGAADGTRPKRHRVRTAAREAVEENLLPRVEKLRQASNVVLDEAAYDPSLRFILIAVALFIIFLVILFASKVLG